MFKLIGAIFKYSLLVLVILILSHIVEVKGVTISQHVLNAIHFVSGYSPEKQMKKITDGYSTVMKNRMEQLRSVDSEISKDDQKALNQVIQKSEGRK
jgi:predicted S18 family serine protease